MTDIPPTDPNSAATAPGPDAIPAHHLVLLAAAAAVAMAGRPHRVVTIHVPAHRVPLWRLEAS